MKFTVVFDRECHFCQSNLAWLRRLDWFHRFEAVPYQDPTLYKRFPDLTPHVCQQALHLRMSNGRVEQGGNAVREILIRLPLTLLAAWLLWLPPFPQLLRRIYPVIARRRHGL